MCRPCHNLAHALRCSLPSSHTHARGDTYPVVYITHARLNYFHPFRGSAAATRTRLARVHVLLNESRCSFEECSYSVYSSRGSQQPFSLCAGICAAPRWGQTRPARLLGLYRSKIGTPRLPRGTLHGSLVAVALSLAPSPSYMYVYAREDRTLSASPATLLPWNWYYLCWLNLAWDIPCRIIIWLVRNLMNRVCQLFSTAGEKFRLECVWIWVNEIKSKLLMF